MLQAGDEKEDLGGSQVSFSYFYHHTSVFAVGYRVKKKGKSPFNLLGRISTGKKVCAKHKLRSS